MIVPLISYVLFITIIVLNDSKIYKSLRPKSFKFFNFDKFANDLDLGFLANSDSLPLTCSNYSFTDRYHKHIVTGDLRIFKNNVMRKLFIKGPKYKKV